MPERFQRSRKKGSKLPPNTVCVDRSTLHGNQFVIGGRLSISHWKPDGELDYRVALGTIENAREAVDYFRVYLYCRPLMIARVQRELRGKNVACWCALDQPCHGDVLLECANA